MSGYRYSPPMPFGKHRGQTIDKLPGSYLFWVLESCDTADFGLKNYIREELASRLITQPVMPTPVRDAIDRSFIVAWCRRAAVACHPDRGGSVAAMKLINELRSTL